MHAIGEFLRGRGYVLADTGNYWATKALYRGGVKNGSLSISKRSGWFKDFVSGESGPPEKLANIIAGYVPMFENDCEQEPERIHVTKIYPKECLKRLLPSYQLFLDRGISRNTLDLFQAGMAQKGQMRRRICFPIYNGSNDLVGFAGRWFSADTSKVKMKWKIIGKKGDFIYPRHLHKTPQEEVALVESIGDLLALWEAGIQNVICLFGTSISAIQIGYVSCCYKRVIVALNNDEEAGPKGARTIKRKLGATMLPENVVISLSTKKDFGEMSGDENRKWLDGARKLFNVV